MEGSLKKHGFAIPNPPGKGGIYEQVKEFGPNFCYSAGYTPAFNSEVRWTGKLGRELDIEQRQEAARFCVLNFLAILKEKCGSLKRVKRIVKMLAFAAGTDNFYGQPTVANGASEPLADIFGEEAGRGPNQQSV